MKKIIFFFISIFIFISFSSCSLAFLASKKQAVTIMKDSVTTILINKENPIVENGKYILERNGSPKQIDIIREGYKPETKIITPHRFSPLYFATIGLNTVIGGVVASALAQSLKEDLNEGAEPFMIGAGLWFGAGGGALAGYLSPRLMNYDTNLNLNIPMLKIIKRDSTMKEVLLNKSTFDINFKNVKYQLISVKNYLKGKDRYKQASNIKKNIKINNSIFTDKINDILRKNGFVDTSGLALKGSYKENIYINCTINELNFTRVLCNAKKGLINPVYVEDLYNCFSTINLKTRWDVLDIYKNVIYSDTLILKSTELLEDSSVIEEDILENHITDAMQNGLYTVMNSSKFKTAVTISKSKITDLLKEMAIQKPLRFVNTLDDAIKATATIKTKSGHGSGFIISEDGYIITNYHVIADSTKLEVILNDGIKTKAKVIQYNKEADLAILKIEKSGLTPFLLQESESLNMGKEIYVIGTPSAENLSQTLTKGIISSIRKQPDGSKLIQTDASINSGSSGGPLVDKSGKLLGVVNAKLVGVGVEGISFAIPASSIMSNLKLVWK